MDVDGYKIVNVYKPPPTQLRTLDLPVYPHPCLYAGDFNCCHADWGYDDNSSDGECLAGWASINCLALLYNAKDTASFYSSHWNTGTNPDLAFASLGPNSCLPDRRVLEKFPRSQHRPSLITAPRFAMAVPSMPVKRWNFRRAKWSHYIALTNKFAKTLLPPDSLDVDAAYQDFCNTINPLSPELILNGKKIFFDYISFKTLLSYNIEPKFKKKIFFYVFFKRTNSSFQAYQLKIGNYENQDNF